MGKIIICNRTQLKHAFIFKKVEVILKKGKVDDLGNYTKCTLFKHNKQNYMCYTKLNKFSVRFVFVEI